VTRCCRPPVHLYRRQATCQGLHGSCGPSTPRHCGSMFLLPKHKRQRPAKKAATLASSTTSARTTSAHVRALSVSVAPPTSVALSNPALTCAVGCLAAVGAALLVFWLWRRRRRRQREAAVKDKHQQIEDAKEDAVAAFQHRLQQDHSNKLIGLLGGPGFEIAKEAGGRAQGNNIGRK